MKKVIFLIGLIVVIFAGGFYVAALPVEEEVVTPETDEDYYNRLSSQCIARKGENCCLASVKIMRENNYALLPEEGCPDGTRERKLSCFSTYRWCEPL